MGVWHSLFHTLVCYVEVKYQHPPAINVDIAVRQTLLDEIVNKLCEATVDSDAYEVTLTITGAGGFGKSTIIKALCHRPEVKQRFTDGFVNIKLGPKATDPILILRDLYRLLSNKQCNINVVEQSIKQLTSDYYPNLLVIIDDVWNVEDVDPLVKAFSSCKIIIITRMNDIESYISSKHLCTIGPMECDEAVALLTNGIIDINHLSRATKGLVDDLIQDVHLWPLLLSLVRAHISSDLKQYHCSYHNAIQNAQVKLRDKGLTAFDKNVVDSTSKYSSHTLSVQVCIETTLEELFKKSQSLLNRFKSLVLWTGIRISVPNAVLHSIWNISEQDTKETADNLWACGIVKEVTIPLHNNALQCIEVEAHFSEYILECMGSNKIVALSPFLDNKLNAKIIKELISAHQQSSVVQNPSLLPALDYLKYKLSEIENVWLPFYYRTVNLHIFTDPHVVIVKLQEILKKISCTKDWSNEFNPLMADYKRALKVSNKVYKNLNQTVHERNHDKLIQSIENIVKNLSLCNPAHKTVDLLNKLKPYYEGEILQHIIIISEELQMMMPDYHDITTLILPHLKLYNNIRKQISSSLQINSPDAEYRYFKSGKFDRDIELLKFNHLIKLQKIAPNYVAKVHQQAIVH